MVPRKKNQESENEKKDKLLFFNKWKSGKVKKKIENEEGYSSNISYVLPDVWLHNLQ